MAAEDIEELFRQASGLTSATNAQQSIVQLYAQWATLSAGSDDSLLRLVRRKLTAGGKTAQIRETLEETLQAGGAVGSSVEEMLIKSGLVGWS